MTLAAHSIDKTRIEEEQSVCPAHTFTRTHIHTGFIGQRHLLKGLISQSLTATSRTKSEAEVRKSLKRRRRGRLVRRRKRRRRNWRCEEQEGRVGRAAGGEREEEQLTQNQRLAEAQ